MSEVKKKRDSSPVTTTVRASGIVIQKGVGISGLSYDDTQKALTATSTEWAPWYVVPADKKWVTRALGADILTTTLRSLDLRYPEVTEEQRQALAEARKQLEAE